MCAACCAFSRFTMAFSRFLWVVFHRSPADRHTLALLSGYLQNLPFWWRQGRDSVLITCTNPLWSLATEEQFYLVWPFLVLLVRNRARLAWLALGLALLAPLMRVLLLAHGAPIDEAYKMTICRADSLLGGAWLALCRTRAPQGDGAAVCGARLPAGLCGLCGHGVAVRKLRLRGERGRRSVRLHHSGGGDDVVAGHGAATRHAGFPRHARAGVCASWAGTAMGCMCTISC